MDGNARQASQSRPGVRVFVMGAEGRVEESVRPQALVRELKSPPRIFHSTQQLSFAPQLEPRATPPPHCDSDNKSFGSERGLLVSGASREALNVSRPPSAFKPAPMPQAAPQPMPRYVLYRHEASSQTAEDLGASAREGELRDIIARIKSDLDQANNTLMVYKSELQQSHQQLEQQRSQLSQVEEGQTARQEAAARAAQAREEAALAARNRLAEELAQTQAVARALQSDRAELERALQAGREREAQAEKSAAESLAKAQSALLAAEKRAAALEEKLSAAAPSDELETALRAAKLHTQELETANSAFAEREVLFAERLQEAIQRIEDLMDKNDQLESALQLALEKQEQPREALPAPRNPLRGQVYSLVEESVGLEVWCETLRMDLNQLRKDHERAEEELAACTAALGQSRAQLQAQQLLAQQSSARGEEELGRLRVENERLQGELERRDFSLVSSAAKPSLKDIILTTMEPGALGREEPLAEELVEMQSPKSELSSLKHVALHGLASPAALQVERGAPGELERLREEVETRRRAHKKLQQLYFLTAIRLVGGLSELERLRGERISF